jgi:hypothetical protein
MAGERSVPFGRWGRLESPDDAAGCHVLIERDTSPTRNVPPPPDAIRIWHRRPGTAWDHGDNWSMWLHEPDLPDWFERAGWRIEDWLLSGDEPDWGLPSGGLNQVP